MNYGRLLAAAVAATVGDALYGFVVYGILIAPEFAKYPNLYRFAEGNQPFLPYMFAGIFVAMMAVTALYAKGFEGGSGLGEGIRFGLRLGVFMALFIVERELRHAEHEQEAGADAGRRRASSNGCWPAR